jgi:hypothetical protein
MQHVTPCSAAGDCWAIRTRSGPATKFSLPMVGDSLAVGENSRARLVSSGEPENRRFLVDGVMMMNHVTPRSGREDARVV